MAIEFNWDPLDYPYRSEKTARGWEVERTAHVFGLEGSAGSQIVAATDAVGVNYGDPFDGIPTATCESISAIGSNRSVDQCFIRYIYREIGVVPIGEDLGDVEIEMEAHQERSDFNADGEHTTLKYKDNPEVNALYSRYIPVCVVTITRNETANPKWKKIYVGTTNAGGWAFDPGAEENLYLCGGIFSKLEKDGSWNVKYRFPFKEQEVDGTKWGWDQRLFWTDPKTGKMPADLVEGTGKKWGKAHKRMNWAGIFS